LPQDIDRVEIAMTETVALRHVCKATEQDLPSRFVENLGTGDVCRQPRLQTAELAGRMGMNASMQPGEYLQAVRYNARIPSHALRKRSLVYTVEYDTLAPADPSTPQTAGTGSAIASTAAWIAASRNAVGFLAEER
jgi:hypothetical protein